jgi:hypothetical protein
MEIGIYRHNFRYKKWENAKNNKKSEINSLGEV